MKRFALSLAILLISLSAFGQVTVEKQKSLLGVTNPVIVGDRIFVGDDSVPVVSDVAVITIDDSYKFSRLKIRRGNERIEPESIGESKYLVAGAGSYVIDVILFDPERGIWDDEFSVELGGKTPTPVPVPDDQDDDDETEPPIPAPIPADGFRVLIVYETSTVSLLPRGQQNILSSPVVRNYLNTHCVRGPDGWTPEWRQYDQDTIFPTTCTEVWCKAMARKRDAVPWVVISDGKTGFEGPLPGSVDEMMTLLKKYGGE